MYIVLAIILLVFGGFVVGICFEGLIYAIAHGMPIEIGTLLYASVGVIIVCLIIGYFYLAVKFKKLNKIIKSVYKK